MILTLSKEQIGTPSVPHERRNEKQKHVPVDYKQQFINGIEEIKLERDSDTGKPRRKQTFAFMGDTISNDVQHYHLNYMIYLSKCWADHLGVVVSPDIIWFTLLSEIATIIKNGPEIYRHLFSTSKEKQDIIIACADPVVINLDTLSSVLKERVPTDTQHFFPEFTTSTPQSMHAFQATFCDMCSPYYNYMMYLCNIPKIDVQGTFDDWKELAHKWRILATILFDKESTVHHIWIKQVNETLTALLTNFYDKEFWKTIFGIKHCGSGGQIEVFGWFANLFLKQPKPRYPENFANHMSIVKYKQLNYNADYEMSVGLFSSQLQDEFMIPNFNYVVHQVV